MTVYYINQLLILGLAFPLCLYKPNKIKKAAYLVITFGYMWFLATFRLGIGFDYYSYIEIFMRIKAAPDLPAVFAMPHEPGFELFSWAMAKFVTSPVVMYGIYSAAILIPVAVFIFFYSKDAWLSAWTYVMLSYFYSSMSFIRQNLACGIVLMGYKFLREKKPIPYFCIVLLGASFHKTALIMIPLYFLSHLRFGKKTGAFYAAVTLIGYLTSVPILNIVTNYIFKSYKDSIYIDTANGFPLIFLLVPFVIFVACLALWPIWEKRDPDANMLTNMMLFSAIMWLFITRHFIIERFSHYSYMLAMVAIPTALSCLKSPAQDYALLAELDTAEKLENKAGKRQSKGKAELNQTRQLRQRISDHTKYYWSGVVAFLLITGVYNEFGQHINNFHNVFPYRSVLVEGRPNLSDWYKWRAYDINKGNADYMVDYIEKMDNPELVYIFTVRDEASSNLVPQVSAAMRKIGLREEIKYRHGYVAVIEKSQVVYEAVSADKIEYTLGIGGRDIQITSAGFESGDISSVMIDGIDYSLNNRGINIVIYDPATEAVLDSACFDTFYNLAVS